MIKRIRFATRRSGLRRDAFAAAWRDRAGAAADAPAGVRPARVALCVALAGLEGVPRHDGIGIEWFADDDHLDRFRSWLDGPVGGEAVRALDDVVDPDRSPLVVADEHVRRGGEWLEQRWRDGAVRLKHMALAVRAGGLTPTDFADRWRSHAGTAGGGGAQAPLVIPDDVRGRAYVQNSPRPCAQDAAYDAVNEVYLDDRDALVRRIDWFRHNVEDRDVADLVSARWFIAAEETVLPGRVS